MAAAMLSILFWATPRARRQLDLLVIGSVWFATTLLVMLGNLRVVDDLVDAGYSNTPTSSVPDVADHSLANSSVWYAAVAALLLVAAWRRRRHIGNRATIGAVFATVIIPPWIIPGAGVIVVAIVRLVQRGRAAVTGAGQQ
jgi:MYXO-CTERM domain-containing protein